MGRLGLRKLRKKINKHAFSGGGKTEEEQRASGANLDVDVSYQRLGLSRFLRM